jgi:hypothetical protein
MKAHRLRFLLEERGIPMKTFFSGLASLLLAAGPSWAQTSVVCDSAGDVSWGNGNGGPDSPDVPPWLDIVQSVVAADQTATNLLFSMTLSAPIPGAPAWTGAKSLWWGWRMIGDLPLVRFKTGCTGPNGWEAPNAYFLDLIFDVETASFSARLLDDTSCTQIEVPFVISPDRSELTLFVSRDLLGNTALFPDPDTFLYEATTVAWKGPLGTFAVKHVDFAPDGLLATWSASTSNTYSCP